MKMTFFGWLLTTVSITASAFVCNWCVCVWVCVHVLNLSMCNCRGQSIAADNR